LPDRAIGHDREVSSIFPQVKIFVSPRSLAIRDGEFIEACTNLGGAVKAIVPWQASGYGAFNECFRDCML
jgi:hypothetical protein